MVRRRRGSGRRAPADQGYRLVPFVFEFRSVLDWTVTRTTLTFGQWLKIEDIYSTNYDIKSCARARPGSTRGGGADRPAVAGARTGPGSPDREMQKRQNRQVGDTQNPWEQWTVGLVVLAGLILLVWFPLILLATPGTTTLNPPLSMRVILSASARYTGPGPRAPPAHPIGLGRRRDGRLACVGGLRRRQQPGGAVHAGDHAVGHPAADRGAAAEPDRDRARGLHRPAGDGQLQHCDDEPRTSVEDAPVAAVGAAGLIARVCV